MLLLFAKKLTSVIVFFHFCLLGDILMTEKGVRCRIIIAIYIFTCTETSRKGVGVCTICGNFPISRVMPAGILLTPGKHGKMDNQIRLQSV